MTPDESIVEFLRTKRSCSCSTTASTSSTCRGRFAEAVLRDVPGCASWPPAAKGSRSRANSSGRCARSTFPTRRRSRATSLTSERRRAVRRARRVRSSPTFVLDDGDAAAVVGVCRRLDGIPLAIELAAARVVADDARRDRAHLDERFRLLTGGRRTAVERHQTLRATVDWSYSLLDDRATVFDRLGVFVGIFDADAADAVVAGDGIEAWDVVERSRVWWRSRWWSPRAGPLTRRGTRCSRRCGSTRTTPRRNRRRRPWRRRHAEHYAWFTERLGPGSTARRAGVAGQLHAELDNLQRR